MFSLIVHRGAWRGRVLVANKCDLEGERKVSYQEGKGAFNTSFRTFFLRDKCLMLGCAALAEEYGGIPFIECSALKVHTTPLVNERESMCCFRRLIAMKFFTRQYVKSGTRSCHVAARAFVLYGDVATVHCLRRKMDEQEGRKKKEKEEGNFWSWCTIL